MNIAKSLLEGTQKLGAGATRVPVRAEVALANMLPRELIAALGHSRLNNLGHAFNPGNEAAQEFSQRFPAMYNKLVSPHDYRFREAGTEPGAELAYGLGLPATIGAGSLGYGLSQNAVAGPEQQLQQQQSEEQEAKLAWLLDQLARQREQVLQIDPGTGP